jgi:hypothetical protein
MTLEVSMPGWRDAEKWLTSFLTMEREDERSLSFHGGFIPEVAKSLIVRLTCDGDWVWDPFAGSGTTGVVCNELQRNCLLTDLNPTRDCIGKADARHVRPKCTPSLPLRPVLDNTQFGEDFEFDLVILHPPYHNAITFSGDEGDLSNCSDLAAFYNSWFSVCYNISRHVKKGGYVGLVIGDVWVTGEARVEPLGFKCLETLLNTLPGGKLKAIQVKNIVGNRQFERRKNFMLSRFFRWGACRFAHEYIFTVRREK